MLLLKRGDKSEAVKHVQAALVQLDFDIGKSGADGIFGGDTEQAVRAFQGQSGLDVDGKVGRDTLTALGLDPNTAEPVGEVVIFTPEETFVPPVVTEQINEYVDIVADRHAKLIGSSLSALDNFSETMSFASTKDANPDILGAVVGTVYDWAVDQIKDAVPEGKAFSFAFNTLKAIGGELERAEQAQASVNARNWIINKRNAIEEVRSSFNRAKLKKEITQSFLEAADKDRFVAELGELNEKLGDDEILPNFVMFELKLYEQWINAHFRGFNDNGAGYIEYRYEVDDEGLNFVSCLVQAPFGDKVEDGLNNVFDRLIKFKILLRPDDLKVHKRACFFRHTLPVLFCGWLDADNKVVMTPPQDFAAKAINDKVWRISVKRFHRGD